MLTRKAACHLRTKVACLAKNNTTDGAERVLNQNADKETRYSTEHQRRLPLKYKQTPKLQVKCHLLWGCLQLCELAGSNPVLEGCNQRLFTTNDQQRRQIRPEMSELVYINPGRNGP